MDILILGRIQIIRDDGRLCPVTRPLVRGAMFTFALSPNQSLTPERLIDLLWGDGDEADRSHSLRSCIWNLRRILPPGRLVTDDVGYRLDVDRDDDRVDVDRFRRLHQQGRAALAAGDPREAAGLLDEAVRLWGPGRLSDLLPSTPAMTSLVAGVCDEGRDARMAMVQARLALGQHRELLSTLHTLIAADPLNEQLWSDLMLALYRSGLKADALQTFARARRALAVQAGVEPGAGLRERFRQIRVDDPALRHGLTADGTQRHGCGQSSPPRQLPTDLTDFTGRTEEAAELIALLSPVTTGDGVSVAEVIGPPGIGKTALAIHVAHAVAHDYPDGQLFLRLGGATSTPPAPGTVLGELLRALGTPAAEIPEPAHERESAYRSRLADRQVLIVLDDAASAAQVRPLVPGTAGSAVIVTSRASLTGVVAGRSINLAPLSHGDARRLFTRIVGRDRLNTDPVTVDQVVEACGRFPLAVRIAAERLVTRPTWPIAYLAGVLADERRRLDELIVGDLEVRATIATGYGTLSRPAQRAFRLLALAGPQEMPAWTGDVLLSAPAADALSELADHSMLTTAGIGAAGHPRYRFHDLVRDYAAELLAADPEAAAARQRLMQGWIELADVADAVIPRGLFAPPSLRPPIDTRRTPEDVRRFVAANPETWFAAERAGVLELIRTGCAAGEYRLGRELAVRTAAYLNAHGYHEDSERMWTVVAKAAERSGDRPFAARAWLRAAIVIGVDRGHHSRALSILDRCIATWQQADDRTRLARAQGVRAYCALSHDRLDQARQDAAHGLDLARKNGDPHTEFLCLRILGATLSRLGRRTEGIACCERAMKIAHDVDPAAYRPAALLSLLKARRRAGQYEDVIDLCHQGLAMRDEPGQAYFHQQLGLAYQQLHRHGQAIEALTTAAGQFQARSERHQAALCWRAVADSYKATDQRDAAIDSLEKCATAFAEADDTRRQREARAALAACRRATSQS